jgi:predicted nucleic acid-binding protein
VPDGLIDTNVFIHAQTHDAFAEECLRFLEAIANGSLRAEIDPIVLHELSYALPHYRKGMTRDEVAEYLLAILAWPGLTGEKGLMAHTVERWRTVRGLAFVDAYLAARAAPDQRPVYTKNVGELRGQGIEVPEPLPHQS